MADEEIELKTAPADFRSPTTNKTRRMIIEKPKKTSAAAAELLIAESELYEDLIREILLKLPVKSLLRFEQVSRTWLRMIRSNSFISDHYSAARNRQSGPSFFILRISLNDEVETVITQISMEKSKFRIEKNIPLQLRPLPLVRGWKRVPKLFSIGFGLYCIFYLFLEGVVLWNPGTWKLQAVPPSPFRDEKISNEQHLWFCFGHVENKEDGFSYKIGLMYQHHSERINWAPVHRLQLYSSSTDSWKLILTPQGSCCESMSNGVNLKGKYHILSYHYGYDDGYENDCHILTFHYSSELFGRIELPDLLQIAGRSNIINQSFLTLDDDIFLCLIIRWKNKEVSDEEESSDEEVINEEFLDVWVMREYGVKKSWSKERTVPITHQMQMLGYSNSAGGFFFQYCCKLYLYNYESCSVERVPLDYDDIKSSRVVECSAESLIPIKGPRTRLR